MKVAIILHAEPGTHDSMGRAMHALLYTLELHEKGHEVKLVFDGGGTAWIREFAKKDNKLAPMFEDVMKTGRVAGVCKFCIGAFGGDYKDAVALGLRLDGSYREHPSIAGIVGDGYQVITL